MAINDITGDTLRSKWNGNFAPGWDAIWGKELKLPEKALNVADLKDRLSFLDQEAFAYDKATNELLGASINCPPAANVYVWVDGRGACRIKDLYFDPELGIMINLIN